MQSDFFELIEKRESCRAFDPARPVESDKLTRCLEAVRISPSACNSQPWRYIAVTNPALLEKLRPCVQDMGMNRFANDCPALIVVLEERATLSARVGSRIKNQEYASIDIGISAAHFCYAAQAQGLGTCILGWFSEERINRALGLDGTRRVRLVLAMGYALPLPLRTKKRKALSEMSEIRA